MINANDLTWTLQNRGADEEEEEEEEEKRDNNTTDITPLREIGNKLALAAGEKKGRTPSCMFHWWFGGGLYDGEKTKGLLLLLLAQEAMATVVCRPPIVFQAEGRARAVSVARAKREGGWW
jgi:hypothetical protein